MKRIALLTLLIAACSSYEQAGLEDASSELPGAESADSPEDAETNTANFWVEVSPIDDGSGLLVPAQTFGPFVSGDGFVHELLPAVRVNGKVGAIAVTNWSDAPVPGEAASANAELVFEALDGSQRSRTRTDDFGVFGIDLVPGDYTITTTPNNTSVPTRSEVVTFTEDARVDVVLDRGVPLWGRVLDGKGDPIVGAAVWGASATSDATTQNVYTDSAGWYEIRVIPGDWAVVTSGNASVQTPTLRAPVEKVGDGGLRTDLTYAEGEPIAVELRVVDQVTGTGITDVPVTITAASIFGYEGDVASFVTETDTDTNGFVVSKLPPGIYDISIAPSAEQTWEAVTYEGVTLNFDENLSETILAPFETVAMEILSEEGQAVPNAIVRCEENQGGHRTWLATSDESGLVAFDLPPRDLICRVSPPEETQLAVTQVLVGEAFPTEAVLGAGTLITNSVVVQGSNQPAALALVRLSDTEGNIWGSTLTDQDGVYALRVDFASVAARVPR